MAVKLRLQRKGRKKRPFYHIVVADARAPRDGKFIEKIGTYNPMTKPATIDLDRDKAFDWLNKGAQPTDTVKAILKFKGVLYKKHLMRGVKKGAFSEEKAVEMWNEFIASKEEKIASRFEQTAQENRDRLISIFGKAPEKPKAEEVAEAPAEETEETVEESAATDVAQSEEE